MLFWVGLAVRILYITFAHTYRIRAYSLDGFNFGWEAGRIARSLAQGHGYADPFVWGHTGPTAWLPPVYPLLMAGAFKIFGAYTASAAWLIFAIDSVFSAATALFVYEIAHRCFNRGVAIWSGWIWALYPAAMQYSVRWAWEMSLTAMLFAATLVVALRVRGIGEDPTLRNPQTTRRWALFGLLWALIALSNPSLILFLPVCGLWMFIGAKNKPQTLLRSTLAAVVFLLCLSPWAWRNWQVFHAFIPLRSNFGAELNMASNPAYLGFPWGVTVFTMRDIHEYTQKGEVTFVKERGEKAKLRIRRAPEQFAALTLKRFYMFWASVPRGDEPHPWLVWVRDLNYCFFSLTGLLGAALALKRRVPAAGLFAAAFILLPLPYYIVTVGARFRHPLEPLIAVLTVYLFQSATPRAATVVR